VLRPLTLGEIFDRAITLYVRNFAPFSLVALAVIVPVAVLQYFVGLHASQTMTQLLEQMQHPATAAVPVETAQEQTMSVVMLGASIVLNVFGVVAMAAATGRLYRGEKVEWGPCWRQTLRRTPAIIGTLLIEAAVMLAGALAGGMVLGFLFIAAAFAFRGAAALALAMVVLIALAVLAGFLVFFLCALAFGFAYAALGVESMTIWASIGSGFRRIFTRAELGRAILASLALMAIYLGIGIAGVSIGGVLEFAHLHVLNVAVSATAGLLSLCFVGILIAVYYFDVRVRREGLDLQVQIEQLSAAASAP
jgi:hypothetical protein